MALIDLLRKAKKGGDPTLTKEQSIAEINQIFDKEARDYSRMIIDRIIYRNILYYMGEQWVEFIKSTGNFRKRTFPDFVPTPVSNQIRDAVRSGKALLLNQKMVPKIWPNSNDREDIKAAQLGEQVLTYLDAVDDQMEDEKEKICIWLYLAGTAFMRTYLDVFKGGWFMTKEGPMTTGDVTCESVPPFNVVLDWNGDTLKKKRWVGIQTLKPKEWVEDTFKVKVAGGRVSPGVVDYQRKLMKLVGQVSPWKGSGLESIMSEVDDMDLVLFREIEFKPTSEYPLGRYLAVCEDKMLIDAKRMPILPDEASGDFYYTLTDFHFDYVPGRFWSDPGMNDLISPQNAINEIDQALAVNRKGLGRPRVLVASDVKLQKMTESGSALLVIKYDSALNMGRPPQIDNGTPLPPQVLQERDIQRATIQDSTGDPKNILKGAPPSAASSGIQVDILRETAEKGHAPDIDRFHRAMSRVYKKRILVVKECYSEQRMIKIAGQGSQVKVMAFTGADLRNNTDIRLELDSGMAQSKTGQRQLLLDLAKQGLFGPVDQNPELRQELLTRFGLTGFSEATNTDQIRAEDENARIAMNQPQGLMVINDQPEYQTDPQTGQPMTDPQTGQPMQKEFLEKTVMQDDPLFRFDNHQIHYEIHRRFILSEQFRALDPRAQNVMISHADLHNQIVQVEMMKQLQMQQMTQSTPAPKGEASQPKESGGTRYGRS